MYSLFKQACTPSKVLMGFLIALIGCGEFKSHEIEAIPQPDIVTVNDIYEVFYPSLQDFERLNLREETPTTPEIATDVITAGQWGALIININVTSKCWWRAKIWEWETNKWSNTEIRNELAENYNITVKMPDGDGYRIENPPDKINIRELKAQGKYKILVGCEILRVSSGTSRSVTPMGLVYLKSIMVDFSKLPKN